jgi:hypothetical protein
MVNVVRGSLDSSLIHLNLVYDLLLGLSAEPSLDLEVHHILSTTFANSCLLSLHPCLVEECCLSETTIYN